MSKVEQEIVLGVVAVDNIWEVDWTDLSGCGIIHTGAWDGTQLLYSKNHSGTELEILWEHIMELTGSRDFDWELYEVEGQGYVFNLPEGIVRIVA